MVSYPVTTGTPCSGSRRAQHGNNDMRICKEAIHLISLLPMTFNINWLMCVIRLYNFAEEMSVEVTRCRVHTPIWQTISNTIRQDRIWG